MENRITKFFLLSILISVVISCQIGNNSTNETVKQLPSVPTSLIFSEVTANQGILSWKASSGNFDIKEYRIYQDDIEIGLSKNLSYKVTDLIPDTKYKFNVSAYDIRGNKSELSSEINVTIATQDKVLVFTKTDGFVHSSISDGVTAIKNLGEINNFYVLQSDNASDITNENLQQYSLVIFLNTTGNIFTLEQELAFENYIQSGGSFMGIHAAADTEYNWEWYGKLVGAYFQSHPKVQNAVISIVTKDFPSTAHLENIWIRKDEWYNYTNLNPNITPVLNLDESSYSGGTMGNVHPIAWHHMYDGGRSFYTGMGHTSESFEEPDFQQHLLGGILWCLNR